MDMQAKRTPANNDNPVVRFISAFSPGFKSCFTDLPESPSDMGCISTHLAMLLNCQPMPTTVSPRSSVSEGCRRRRDQKVRRPAEADVRPPSPGLLRRMPTRQ